VAAIDIARQTRDETSIINIITVFPTNLPNETLSSLLSPWPEFVFGADCRSPEEMAQAVIGERPHLVLLGHQFIADVVATRGKLRAARVREPRWVLMLMHLDTPTLMSAAMANIEHVILPEHFTPADQLPNLLRNCAHGSPSGNSPISRIQSQLSAANDDDDRNILRLLVSGATNAEIAEQVFLSEQTVKNRLSRMMKVASVNNRTEMALLFANARTTTTPDR
jgi:DNA-binding NarL/FixJ family response regulator